MAQLHLSRDFTRRCQARILAVFSALGLEPPTFTAQRADLDYLVAKFQQEMRTLRIEIYAENVVMYESTGGSERLRECYMPSEFDTEDSLIEGFTTRLARFLSGGHWEGAGEQGLPDRVALAVNQMGSALKRLARL